MSKTFGKVSIPCFACISLGKVSFCLISFDARFCLKRNSEVDIVSWIVKTYSNLEKLYTLEVEKSPENHLSLCKRRQIRVCLSPVLETIESMDIDMQDKRAQTFFKLRERCILKKN